MKRIRKGSLLVSIVLILSLILSAGCDLLPSISPTSSPPATQSTTPANPEYTVPSSTSQPALPDFTSVVAKVKPSVVAINTEVIAYDFFNRPITQEGAGSGWVLDEDGYIVTNNHVIADAQSITVVLADGRALPASVVGADIIEDLAVLKVDASNLPVLNIGDSSNLQLGEWVLAIGNALGMGISVKQGIISRLDVSISVEDETLYNLIETSAAINPGNSGGPLVNMAGEMIGITSAKVAASGIEGLGYAISANTAEPIIQQLINTGYVIRPWLGVAAYSVDPFVVFRFDLSVDSGAFVTDIVAGSPADKAGLREGDVIVSLNNEEITGNQDLQQAIISSQIGQEVEIIYWRGTTRNTTRATLIETPPPS